MLPRQHAMNIDRLRELLWKFTLDKVFFCHIVVFPFIFQPTHSQLWAIIKLFTLCINIWEFFLLRCHVLYSFLSAICCEGEVKNSWKITLCSKIEISEESFIVKVESCWGGERTEAASEKWEWKIGRHRRCLASYMWQGERERNESEVRQIQIWNLYEITTKHKTSLPSLIVWCSVIK